MVHTLFRGVRPTVLTGNIRTPAALVLVALCLAPATPTAGAAEATVDGDTIVYITPNPTFYHRWECRLLSRPQEIGLDAASARYKPCQACRAPRPGDPVAAPTHEPVRAAPAVPLPPIARDLEYRDRTSRPKAHSHAKPQDSDLLYDPAKRGPVSSFAELARRIPLYEGEKVWVVTPSGESKGKLRSLTADELVLITGKGRRVFTEADTLEIQVTREDSIRDGLLVGIGVGAGLGVLTIASACGSGDCGDTGAVVANGVLVSALLGGAFGGLFAGLDAIHHERVVVYKSSRVWSKAPQVRIEPVAVKRGAGATLALHF